MFIPLTKADAAQRLVYGSIDETLDRAGEILDYATAKPAFEAWSKVFSDATEGKSLGNIRAQHDLKKAAGKLVELTFDDLAKSISFVAKIVDDAEWAKVEECVYTGFSPGGSYAKRWQDGSAKRYTPKVGELSIVDIPCIPSGTFSFIKADGTEEDREFVLSKVYEPGNEATVKRSEELAKAVGNGAKSKDYVVKARSDLISENADAEFAKMANEVEVEAAPAPAADPVNTLAAALAKGAAAVTAAAPPPPEDDPATKLAKGLDEIVLAHADDAVLAKGLRGIQSLSRAIYQVVGVQADVQREAISEGDGSAVPASIVDGIKTLCDALCQMAMEETAELLADIAEAGMEPAGYPTMDYYCAAAITDLAKADTELMEKAGKRNSKGDAGKIQSMHDNSVQLGATCEVGADKVECLAAENKRLNKAFGDALPQIETLTKAFETQTEELAKANARVAVLEALPVPPKGVVTASKESDSEGGLSKVDEPKVELTRVEKANLILRKAQIRAY